MRLSRRADTVAISFLSLLSLSGVSAVSVDCKNVRVDKQNYDLSPLSGPHSVHWIREEDPSTKNFTFTVDLCAPLKRTKGVAKDKECPTGTHVCGMDYVFDGSGNSILERVVPIAGNYITQTHRLLDPHWTRLKDSASNADSEKDGLRVELNGGQYPFDKKGGRQQKAILEFLCDKDKTGLEGDDNDGFEDDPDAAKDEKMMRRDDEKEGGDKKDEGGHSNPKQSLIFQSYKAEGKDGEIDVLRLQWSTKYACEGAAAEIPKPGEHWGFFTWLIVILFLSISGYLIFGSWLNYSRYGARGWDLLPHGDTIRDVPYYLKEYARNIISAFQSPARRGGYSAV